MSVKFWLEFCPKEYFDPKKMFVKHIPLLFYYCYHCLLLPTYNTIGSGWRRKERKGESEWKERGKNSRIKGENWDNKWKKRKRSWNSTTRVEKWNYNFNLNKNMFNSLKAFADKWSSLGPELCISHLWVKD